MINNIEHPFICYRFSCRFLVTVITIFKVRGQQWYMRSMKVYYKIKISGVSWACVSTHRHTTESI